MDLFKLIYCYVVLGFLLYATIAKVENVLRGVRKFISTCYLFQLVKNVTALFTFIFLARDRDRILQSYPVVSGTLLKIF